MNQESDVVEHALGELRAAGVDDAEVAAFRRVLVEAVDRGWPSHYPAEMVRFKLALRERREQ